MLKKTFVKTKTSISPVVAVSIIAATIGLAVIALIYNMSASLPAVSVGSCGDNICGPMEQANPNLCPQDCGAAKPITAFIAVHMEVGGGGTTYTTNMWPKLVELVMLADQYNFKLTLEFNPQWATYILKDAAKLTALQGWGANGHEIALHHHGPSHADWNGYTNREDKKNDSRYLGTVADMMVLVKKLPATGKILTAGATDEATDWPAGVTYSTDGGTDKGDLLSTPQAVVFNGQSVKQLSHRMYAVNVPQSAPLSEIEASYSLAGNQIMGIVFHVHDYAQRKLEIEKLFQSLSQNKATVKTVKSILAQAL